MDNRTPHQLPPPGYLYPPHSMPPHLGPPLVPQLAPQLAPPQLNPSAPHLLGLASTVPSKRDSDEVQFVSSNPVKKRKLDGVTSPTSSLPAVTAFPSAASHDALPVVQGPQPMVTSIPASTSCPQSEFNMSTVAPQESSTEEAAQQDPLRGVSEPALSTTDFSDMWTAPSRGPRSSPAVSPKQMPLNHLPLPLRMSQSVPGASQPAPTPTPDQTRALEVAAQPDAAQSESQTSQQPQPVEEKSREIHAPVPQPGFPSFLAQLDVRGLDMLSGDEKQPLNPSDGDNLPNCPVKVDPGQQQQPGHNTMGPNGVSFAGQVPDLASEVVGGRIAAATTEQIQDAGPQQILNPSPSQPSIPTQQQDGKVQCQGGTRHSAKSNCFHCFSAWLRRNGVLQAPGVMTTTTTKPQMMPYQPIYQQQWPQTFTMGGFPSPYQNAVTYAQLLRQQASATKEQGSQHSSIIPQAPIAPMTSNMSAQPVSATMLQSPMWNTQPTGHFQSQQPTSRQTQGHPAGKHIIVDMAETCLESFPFDEFAERHNQSPKRIREIFEAIIQMPLLRCPTDKRRAGKVATAKMKEYTQAKKDLQGLMSGGQTQNQGMMPQPSALEMAQFMGPSDVQIPGHLAFPGPW